MTTWSSRSECGADGVHLGREDASKSPQLVRAWVAML